MRGLQGIEAETARAVYRAVVERLEGAVTVALIAAATDTSIGIGIAPDHRAKHRGGATPSR